MNAPDKFLANSAAANDPRHDPARVIRAPRGSQLTCKSWLTEAPFRMLQNNLDPEVAERPQDLVVYGGIGRAARNWACFDQILASLQGAGGRRDAADPVGQAGRRVQDARRRAARADRQLQPGAEVGTWEHFNELDRKGLMMYGQMTAGSWIYIGSQGIVQGTFETFVEAGRQHYGNDLAGQVDPHRRPRRHGRRAAAGRHAGRRLCRSRSNASSRASTSACARATSTSRRSDIDDALALIQHHTRAQGSGVDRAARQRGRGAARAGAARQGRRPSSPTW